MKSAELIFIPTPFMGHLISTLEFARHLIDHSDEIQITILLMKFHGQGQLETYAKSFAASHPSVCLINVPELEEQPKNATQSVEAHIYEVIEKHIPLVRHIIMDIVASRRSEVRGLVFDFFCLPMIEIANEASLPPYVFLTSNAGFLALLQYIPERNRNDTSAIEENSEDGLPILGFVNPVPPKALPSGLFMEEGYETWVKLGKFIAKAKAILVNTSIYIEPHFMNHFLHEHNFPCVYSVGPLVNLKPNVHDDGEMSVREEVIGWLDHQPEASVVFLCFGSMGKLSSPQVKETAQALEQLSSYRFIWSLRTQHSEKENYDTLLPEGFRDRVRGRGIVCGWSPQKEILGHKAVGGFVSHCGWNSILESLWFGVPILTWPMYAEQQLNAFVMVKELGLAVEMKLDYRMSDHDLVSAKEIENGVRSLMEEDGVEVRKKVMEISEMTRKCVMKGGSSYAAIEKFIQDEIGVN